VTNPFGIHGFSRPTLTYDALVDRFLDQTLETQHWTHQAHLIIGLWHLKNYDPLDALCRIKAGIILYNKASGGENSGNGGYHETITIFWWHILHRFIAMYTDLPFPSLCDQFLLSEWADKNLALNYYSRELLFSREARAIWKAPDLKPLDSGNTF
jgi:hypothetical protein